MANKQAQRENKGQKGDKGRARSNPTRNKVKD